MPRRRRDTPLVSVTHWRTLHSSEPINEIDDRDLNKATNVFIDDDANLVARPALSAWNVGPIDTMTHSVVPGKQCTYYVGSIWHTVNVAPSHFFYSGEGGYSTNWLYGSVSPYLTGGPWPWGRIWISDLASQGDQLLPVLMEASHPGGGTQVRTDFQTRGFEYAFDPSPPDPPAGLAGDEFQNFLILGGYWPDSLVGTESPHMKINDTFSPTMTPYQEPNVPNGPDNSTHIVYHKDRAWAFSNYSIDHKIRLYFSAAGRLDVWPSPDGGFIDIGNQDEGLIRWLISFKDNLYIFKQGAVYVLYTAGAPNNWTLRKLSDYGCIGVTPCVHAGSIFWAAPNGFYEWDGNSTQRISDPIQDLFYNNNGIFDGNSLWATTGNHAQFAWVRSCAYKGNWYVCVPVTKDQGTQRLFVYNIKNKFWSEIKFPYIMGDITDIFSVVRDIEIDDFFTVEGVYIAVQHNWQELPVIYKLETHVGAWGMPLRDEFVVMASTVDASSSGYTLVSTDAITSDYLPDDMWVQFIDGTEGFTKGFKVLSYGGSTITLDDGGGSIDPPAMATGDHFWLVIHTDVQVDIKTCRWDTGTPFTFKHFKNVVVDFQGSDVSATMEVATGPGLTPAKVQAPVSIFSHPAGRISRVPVGGNFRGIGVALEIIASGYETDLVYSPNDVPIRFKMFGAHVYCQFPFDHGRAFGGVEQVGVNP